MAIATASTADGLKSVRINEILFDRSTKTPSDIWNWRFAMVEIYRHRCPEKGNSKDSDRAIYALSGAGKLFTTLNFPGLANPPSNSNRPRQHHRIYDYRTSSSWYVIWDIASFRFDIIRGARFRPGPDQQTGSLINSVETSLTDLHLSSCVVHVLHATGRRRQLQTSSRVLHSPQPHPHHHQ